METLLGVLGIGLTVIVFVILGNPSAGGTYQSPLLPSFWAAIGTVLPNGAGTDALRRVIYFNGHGIHTAMTVLVIWIVSGAVLTLVGSGLRDAGIISQRLRALMPKWQRSGQSAPAAGQANHTIQPRPADADHGNRAGDEPGQPQHDQQYSMR